MDFRVHLTNVTGLGASQLASSLLPALERIANHRLVHLYLPESGPLSQYAPVNAYTAVSTYRRLAPRQISRLLECTILSRRFDGPTPILVLGDLPLRTTSRQTVFVQTSHLLRTDIGGHTSFGAAIARRLFAASAPRIENVIVQSEVMEAGLVNSYPELSQKIRVVEQPVPQWLLDSGMRRTGRKHEGKLRLFYPAATYPHKNHKLLTNISSIDASSWNVETLTLTIDDGLNPNPKVSWICCCGRLGPEQVIQNYSEVDALLFLSTQESYGFPLVEAMQVGIPIICPDLPYARHLCGSEAIYFSPNDVDSLKLAVVDLYGQLMRGWWPDWRSKLSHIPKSWDETAALIVSAMQL